MAIKNDDDDDVANGLTGYAGYNAAMDGDAVICIQQCSCFTPCAKRGNLI